MDYYFRDMPPVEYDLQDAAKRSNRVGLAFFVLLAASSVAAIVLNLIFTIVFPNAQGSWMLWTISILSLYLCAAPFSLLLFRTVEAEKGKKRNLSLPAFLKFTLIAFTLMIVGAILGTIINGGIEVYFGLEQDSAITEAVEESPLWLTILYTIGMAPLLEEFFFRKLLVDRLAPLGQWVCILVSGFAFGLFHGNIEQFCYATLLGFLLGYIYYNTRNVWYCVAIHAILNFICGVLSTIVTTLVGIDFYAEELTEEALTTLVLEHMPAYALTTVTMLIPYVLAAVGLIFLVTSGKQLISFIEPCPIPKGKRFKTVVVNPGMILFITICVLSMILYIFTL